MLSNLAKRVLNIILVFSLVLTIGGVSTFAGAMPDALSKTGKARAKELYQYCISNGYTKEAACGILGNADQESSFDIPIDCSGTYKGTFQFVSDVAEAIKSWAKKNNLDPDNSLVQYKWLEKNSLERDFKVYSDITLEKFKKIKDVDEATDAFCAAFERCVTNNSGGANANNCKHAKSSSQYYQDLKTRRSYGQAFLKAYAGISPVKSDGSNKENKEENKNLVVKNGTYGIKDPASGLFQTLDESIQKFMDEEGLSEAQKRGVTSWKNNIEYEEDDGIIKFLRIIVMVMGIAFLVWMLLIYLSYWYDRINNFFDIELLPIITGGRLKVAPEEDKCTFNPKEFMVSRGVQTVNHRAVLSLCFIGLFFGTFVVSGKLYDFLSFIITFIMRKLGLL